MGATSWRYYTAYDRDPARALRRLRENVFARGEYTDLTGSLDDQLQATMKRFGPMADDPQVRRDMEGVRKMQRAIESGRTEDLAGLSADERATVKRVRWFTRFARLLGAEPTGTRTRGKPTSIDELLERSEDTGTHSILDITDIAPRRRLGAAAPLGERIIEKTFGTSRPTHDQVEAQWPDVAEALKRDYACYLIVFRDGEPDEYVFIGVSGD